MQRKDRNPPSPPPQDAGAIFDAALARGLKLPDGLSPAAARRFHVEHPPTPWTEQDHQDWLAHFRDRWHKEQDDPRCVAMRAEIRSGLGRPPFAKLDRMPLRCDRSSLHAKIIESLADALGALRTDEELREKLDASREFAEHDLQDARDRVGRHPEPWKRIIRDREAKALQALADVRRMQKERRTAKAVQKEIMDRLTLDLFVIVRHVLSQRSAATLDGVSDRRLHAEALIPILRAFQRVSGVKRQAHDGIFLTAPRIRLQRWLAAQRRQSEINADIWRDGRRPEKFEDLIERGRARLFGWDERFDPALFRPR
jgi:hypothetical protein